MTDDLYRELILDHYRSPRRHGELDPADAKAEGQNPLCGDEVTITVRFADGTDVIEDEPRSAAAAARSPRPRPRC